MSVISFSPVGLGVDCPLSSFSPLKCMFAHRRDASTASRGGRGAQFDDAFDDIEEDREEREERSSTIDSGDEMVETDVTSDERRAEVGKGCEIFAERHSHC